MAGTSRERKRVSWRRAVRILSGALPWEVSRRIVIEGRLPEGERKDVTVAFVDLKGSTELSDYVSPPEIQRFLSGLFQDIKEIVEDRYSGMIDKTIGDAVMISFGSHISYEDHADRCLRAVFEIIRLIKEKYKSRVEVGDFKGKLEIHVGVNSGQVYVGCVGPDERYDYTTLGREVNIASRLEGISGPGEVVVSEETVKRLKYTDIEYSKVELRDIRGIREKIKCYWVTGLKDKKREIVVEEFVDRENEKKIIKDKLKDYHVVLVCGDVGVGKSALTKVLAGRHIEVPFHARFTPFYVVDLLLKELGHGIIVKELFERQHRDLPFEERRRNVFQELSGLFSSYKGVVGVANLENVDESSVEFLRQGYLKVIFNSREEIAEFEKIKLEELDEEHAKLLIKKRLGEGANINIDEVYRRTGGNPLLIIEVCKALREGKSLSDIPSSLDLILQEKIDSLDADMSVVFKYLSFLREVDRGVLGSIVPVSGSDLDRALDVLKKKGFIDVVDGKIVADAILADVCYGRIVEDDREKIHGKIAESLEVLRQDVGIVAYHYLRSDKYEKAVEFGLKAAKRAKEMFSNNEAIDLYTRVLGILREHKPDKDLEAEIVFDLVEIYDLIGKRDKALELLKDVDPEKNKINDKNKVRWHILYGLIHQRFGEFEKAKGYYNNALEMSKKLGDEDLEMIVLEKLSYIHVEWAKYDDALKYSERLIELARKHKNYAVLIDGLKNKGNAYLFIGDYGNALRCYNEALKINQETIKNKFKEAALLGNIGGVFSHLGMYREEDEEKKKGWYMKALDYCKRSLRIKEEIGNLRGQAITLNVIGVIYLRLKELDNARKYFIEAMKLNEMLGEKQHFIMNKMNYAVTYLQEGKLDIAEKELTSLVTIIEEVGMDETKGRIFYNLGVIRKLKEDFNGAKRLLEYSLKLAKFTGTEGLKKLVEKELEDLHLKMKKNSS